MGGTGVTGGSARTAKKQGSCKTLRDLNQEKQCQKKVVWPTGTNFHRTSNRQQLLAKSSVKRSNAAQTLFKYHTFIPFIFNCWENSWWLVLIKGQAGFIVLWCIQVQGPPSPELPLEEITTLPTSRMRPHLRWIMTHYCRRSLCYCLT